MHVCMYVCMYICMYYVCMYICMYVCMYVCIMYVCNAIAMQLLQIYFLWVRHCLYVQWTCSGAKERRACTTMKSPAERWQ